MKKYQFEKQDVLPKARVGSGTILVAIITASFIMYNVLNVLVHVIH